VQTIMDEQHRLVTLSLIFPIFAVVTTVLLILASPESPPYLALAALVLIVLAGIRQPVPKAAPILGIVAGLGHAAMVLLDSMSTWPFGLTGAVGLIVLGGLADWLGLSCQASQLAKTQAERIIDELRPIDESSGVTKWAHASLVFEREIARARRYDQPLVLLRVVIDQWDVLKAHLGPASSTEVLHEVGAHLIRSSRVVDVVAYHGDAMFDLLLPDTPGVGAVVVARRVTAFTSSYHGVNLRVGVAPMGAKSWSADELLEQGDIALAMAEREGKPYAVCGIEDVHPALPSPISAVRRAS
jgi:diguanylate cyclase (GGDEF)-like protein